MNITCVQIFGFLVLERQQPKKPRLRLSLDLYLSGVGEVDHQEGFSTAHRRLGSPLGPVRV